MIFIPIWLLVCIILVAISGGFAVGRFFGSRETEKKYASGKENLSELD